MTVNVINAVDSIFGILQLLIIARAVISWIPSIRWHPISVLIVKIVDPPMKPLQKLLPPWKTNGIDFTPMLALILLAILHQVVMGIILPPAPVRILR
jgi:YggT family protein